MELPLRTATADDIDGLWDLFRIGFGASERRREEWVSGLDPARALIAEGPRGEVAAASHIHPFEQWFGGRPVHVGGFSPVAVLPEFRRLGLGKAVTAGQFADLRDRGEVVSGLYPASLALYRSVGFECAGSYVHRRFPAGDLAGIRPRTEVAVRRGTVDDVEAVHRCHLAAAPHRDGTVSRDHGWWARRLPPDLEGTMLYVVDAPNAPGELLGYAIYRHGSARHPYDYSVVVSEVLAADPDVVRALWRVVASSGSQAPDLDVIGPAEDDLFLMVDHAAPDVVRSEIRWMLRLIDAPGAVAARGWAAGVEGSVDLALVDEHAPWNNGTWSLHVADGHGTLTPGGDATVEASIGGLSSWWSGYATATKLARTGHLRSADHRALATMDRLISAAPPVLPDFY
ncbi:GNAT family N-acetyltransferase [Aquihabitans sp. McL0605]|uniref:GNAT family N-acetyltransferase n=1 Tax=Aquihabitans sp. McL0605 TaxID=3415671 RepID=UPI003CF413A4